jgi:hypothetical protein
VRPGGEGVVGSSPSLGTDSKDMSRTATLSACSGGRSLGQTGPGTAGFSGPGAEAQFALAALARMPDDPTAKAMLEKLLRKASPTLVRRMS